MSICRILYSGKPSREKTSANSQRKLFCSLLAHQRMPHPQIHGKTFANSHKIVKFTKVFSLESFPLYGTLMQRDTRTGSLVWSTLSQDLSIGTGSLVWSTWSQDLSIGTGSLVWSTWSQDLSIGTGSLVWSTWSEDLSIGTGSLVWSTWSQDLSIGTGSLKTKVSDTNCGWYCL